MDIKAGSYYPTGDLDNADTGFSGEVTPGYFFKPKWALEGSIGYSKLGDSDNHILSNHALVIDSDASIVPITIGLKRFKSTSNNINLFAGGGVGLYNLSVDVAVTSPTLGKINLDDSDIMQMEHFTPQEILM